MKRTMATFLVVGMVGAASAEIAGVGTSLAPQTLEDQHGEPHALDESVRVVVFTRDMDAGDLVKEALAEVTAEQLAERDVAYVADISGMPKLVARLFALPAMRRRSYPMWLDRDGASTAALPSEAGKVTVLALDRLRVTEISFLDSVAQVRIAVGPAPETAED